MNAIDRDDTEKKIAEIREALEKATPGPWKVKKGERWTEDYPRETYIQAVWDKPDHRGCVGYRVAEMSGVHGKTMRDAYLIANSPEWLRFLLSELDKMDECTPENPCRECLKKSIAGYKELVRELEEERDKLIECLRFYERLARGREVNDGGRRARTLLAEIGVTVE